MDDDHVTGAIMVRCDAMALGGSEYIIISMHETPGRDRRMTITNDKYKEQYEQLHADYKFKGGQVAVFKKEIGRFIKDIKALNVLDYGCGAASAYKKKLHEKWRVPMPFLYEPYNQC